MAIGNGYDAIEVKYIEDKIKIENVLKIEIENNQLKLEERCDRYYFALFSKSEAKELLEHIQKLINQLED